MMANPEELIVGAAEKIQRATGDLIVAIDQISDENMRRELRRDFAELVAFIEEKFVFNVKFERK